MSCLLIRVYEKKLELRELINVAAPKEGRAGVGCSWSVRTGGRSSPYLRRGTDGGARRGTFGGTAWRHADLVTRRRLRHVTDLLFLVEGRSVS